MTTFLLVGRKGDADHEKSRFSLVNRSLVLRPHVNGRTLRNQISNKGAITRAARDDNAVADAAQVRNTSCATQAR
jgi:hypothetical protein